MDYKRQENGLWGAVLVYDIATTPHGVTIDDIIKLYKEQGVVLYDSQNDTRTETRPPYIINPIENIQIQDNAHI